jgi:hypothetical protein
MFNQVIFEVDQTIEYLMKRDESEYGKFTRAYIHSSFIHQIMILFLHGQLYQ